MSLSSNAPDADDNAADALDGTGNGHLSRDDVFHVLQNERRRRVLEYLEKEDGPVAMRDLAEQVAAWEHDTTVERLTSDERQRVYIALYQSHLPKLDEAGIVEYNQSRGTIERTPLADQVEAYLDVSPEDGSQAYASGGDGGADRSWVGYYAGATAVSTILTGAAWIGPVPATIIAAVITALFGVLTALLIVTEGK